ncbi:ABC-three component system protein [Hyalangium versicolor]|uniref:ABC-three component system protein n=1 Tax=Hyalangium versicolor TaxID=2861190 RepID=UPI001CCF61A3|nr:ABC-three component system protein [Hyalangium versicolor]
MTTAFSAADSALGYLYQMRVALLWSLSRIKQGEFVVSLETLDDVTFEAKGGTAEELLQTKHHRTREASLSDMSGDLWKSLRVWFEGHANGRIPAGTSLYLLTTAAAPAGSAASYLRREGRDIARAQTLLEAVPSSSQNQALVPAFTAFNAVSATARRTILDHVIVLDQASGVLTIDNDLKAEVFWTADPKHHDAFLQRLEGWWLRRVIKQLSASPQPAGILSVEIEAEMAELREQFKQDNLPIDDDILKFTLDDATHAAHENYQFVHQLRLIEAGKGRVAAAIRDFYRAGAQRSRWLREELLLIGDLSRYEGKLVEEWDLVFEAAKDEIEATAAETEKRKAARSILTWAERTTIAIRPGVTEPFVVRGSFHMLADEKPPRIGWHPDFHDRLAELLNPSGSVPPGDADADGKDE